MPEASDRLVRRVESIFPITEAERLALAGLAISERTFRPRQDIVREGDRPNQCVLIIEGWSCCYRFLHHGGRQIFSLHIPGDVPDLQSLHLGVMDHSLAAVSAVTAGFISHEHIHALIERHPRLGSALWRQTLIDAAVYRELIMGLGRKEAFPRTAHLLCELFLRMRAVGLTTGQSFPLPTTQVDLGDILGQSNVHVNRTLQEMRGKGLITLENRTLTILDWQGLTEVAEFDPTYLHQDPAGRV